jgi:hypothetical protein
MKATKVFLWPVFNVSFHELYLYEYSVYVPCDLSHIRL